MITRIHQSIKLNSHTLCADGECSPKQALELQSLIGKTE